MFNGLKQRWKVTSVSLLLIFITFATGGSLCGYLGRKLMGLTEIDKGPIWVIVYLLLITLLWPLCVILISIPLGQFAFFRNYLRRIGQRMSGKSTRTIQVAIYASGAGSNAQKIIEYFKNHPRIRIALIVCNKPGAGVLAIAADAGIPTLLIEKDRFLNGDSYLPELQQYHIDFIILAGFLWKVPPQLISRFPSKIVNIHPALLPKYGGKGMYGDKVHAAVIAAGETESGISIHYVDEIYDHGNIIFQATCPVTSKDSPDTLAHKIHQLEHRHYPEVIGQLLEHPNQR